MKSPSHAMHRLSALCVPLALVLAACGGSDDASAPAPDPAPGTLSISGTAAAGAPIASGTVDARCATGSGSTSTGADGSYTLAMDGATLPCSMRVTSADGAMVLHSAATGDGSSARANITPATELAMAQLYGRNPADVHATFDAGAAEAVTPAAVQSAASATTALLAGAGIAISSNPISGALVIGDTNDQALDQLQAALVASGTSFAGLVDAAARGSPNAPPAALSAAASLPAELLLRPAASNCAALRSGRYRLVFFAPGDGGGVFTDTLTLDGPTLTATGADGEVSVLTATGECQYATPSGELVVSQAGIGVLRTQEDSGFIAAMAIPVQAHAVSVTAGDWSFIGLDTGELMGGHLSVDSGGRVTAVRGCDASGNCVPEAPGANEVFIARADGGFDYDGGRAWAYRAGGGETMVVFLTRDGAFAFGTRKVPRTLPAIDSVGRSWNLMITPQLTVPSAFGDSENRTVSHAADGSAYTREAVVNFASGVTRVESLRINSFLDGFIQRLPETVSASDGTNSVVSEWVGLPLRGMGITPVGLLSSNQLILSVTKPPTP